MQEFVFRMPTKVIFAESCIERVGAECSQLGVRKAFVVTGRTATKNSPHLAVLLKSLTEANIKAYVFSEIEADPSVETVDDGAATMRAFRPDIAIAFGGGSPIDAAKAMAMLQTNGDSILDYMLGKQAISRPALPLIAIPTTAGTGSEVTAAAVVTDKHGQRKIGISHDSMMPKLAFIDPVLHTTMPPATTAATGLDALTHAIEAFVAQKAEPISDALCLHAIRLIGENLPLAIADGKNIEVRSKMVLASLMAGAGFANAGLGAVHGIAHAVGAQFGVSHGVANGVLLPYVMEYCLDADPEKFAAIAAALGQPVVGLPPKEAAVKAVLAVSKLKQAVGVPATLAEVGVTAAAVEPIVKDAATYRLLPNSPKLLTAADIERIVRAALGE